MLTKLISAAILFTFAPLSFAQAPPDVPAAIKAPAGRQVVLQVHASGSQIYICLQATDGPYAWILKAPQAELHDDSGAIVGAHYAGPTWKYKDGSEVTGKLAAKADSPDPDSIPWLLLTATAHSGDGLLSRVTSIQRVHTKGGEGPSTVCNNSNLASEVKIPYTADYFFYAAAK